MAARNQKLRATTTEYRVTGQAVDDGARLSRREAERRREARALVDWRHEVEVAPVKPLGIGFALSFAVVMWALFVFVFWWAFV